MIDRLKTSWTGVAIFVALVFAIAAALATGNRDIAFALVALLGGQLLPQPVRAHGADDEPPSAGGAAALLLALGLSLTVSGCAHAPRAVRTTLAASAHAVLVADGIVADRYERARVVELEAAASLEDYRARMRSLDRAVDALAASASSLRAAEHAVDAWDRGNEGATMGVVACSLSSLVEVADALRAANVEPPADLTRALELARGLATLTCDGARP